MPARQSGSLRQQCTGAISAFVDSMDLHIILWMTVSQKEKLSGLCLPVHFSTFAVSFCNIQFLLKSFMEGEKTFCP